MDKPAKKIVKKLLGTDKKTTIAKPDSEKTPEELDKNYRPQGSDEQIGDGSAGMGGTSGI